MPSNAEAASITAGCGRRNPIPIDKFDVYCVVDGCLGVGRAGLLAVVADDELGDDGDIHHETVATTAPTPTAHAPSTTARAYFDVGGDEGGGGGGAATVLMARASTREVRGANMW